MCKWKIDLKRGRLNNNCLNKKSVKIATNQISTVCYSITNLFLRRPLELITLNPKKMGTSRN
jgi:hypothetical protein